MVLKMKVKLLDWTDNGRELTFAAGRQCYAEGFVGDWWSMDEELTARVNNPETDEWFEAEEMEGLLNHLRSAGHTSVLEHAKFTFAIDGVSRALTHQLVRHRIASYSQQSQRYVSNQGTFDMSAFVIPPSIAKNDEAFNVYSHILTDTQIAYNELKKLGIPSEDARYVLPNAAVTRIVVTMNCVSLLHFLGLRCCTAAQWEIRDLANNMLSLAKEKLPVVFKEAGSRCVSLGYCPEDKSRCCGRYPTKVEILESHNAWEFHKKQCDFEKEHNDYIKDQINGNKRD